MATTPVRDTSTSPSAAMFTSLSTATGTPNVSGSFAVGGDDPLLFGHQLGYLFSGTLSQSVDVKSEQVRALADRGTIKGSTNEIDRFTGQTTARKPLDHATYLFWRGGKPADY